MRISVDAKVNPSYWKERRKMFKQKGKLMWDGTVLCSKWWHL